MNTLVINQRQVEELLDKEQLLDVLSDGFKALSAGQNVHVPHRGELAIPGAGLLLTMPAHISNYPLSTKLVTVFENNEGHGLPSHLGLIILMNPETGATEAIMDGAYITAMRTAGSSVLAARLLARAESKVLTIIGAGVQGQRHLELMLKAFDIEKVYIGSRTPKRAAQLATRFPEAEVTDDYEFAVKQSDIICLCSNSATPLIAHDWLQPGQHISSVGYAPPGGELDSAIAANHNLFVESKMAFEPPPVGSAELAGMDHKHGTELGEVLLKLKPGRRSHDEVTVYKSMGHAIEDLVVANMVYRKAKAESKGVEVQI